MFESKRREFLKLLGALSITFSMDGAAAAFSAGRASQEPTAQILNEYTAFLPGEEAALADVPKAIKIDGKIVTFVSGEKRIDVAVGDFVSGWRLLTITSVDEKQVAVLERRAAYRSTIAFASANLETLGVIPSWIGDIATIRPRQIATPTQFQVKRESRHVPGPDVPGNYILSSSEDPCYENVAALGPEYIGWTLVANEQGGPERSLYLQADGTSREFNNKTSQAAWAPDEWGAIFDPSNYFPTFNAQNWKYEQGYSKRTLLAGYLPVADIGVWNTQYKSGYQVTMLLPEGVKAEPMGRIRMMVPEDQVTPRMRIYRDEQGRAFIEKYTAGSNPESFFRELFQIWKKWNSLFESSMPVDIPDEWMLAAARAGITLTRCSYRGLEPSYQVGEGAYTVIPESSHSLGPVAQYEFIWANQIWNLTSSADAYFQYYLDKYVEPDGNYVRNTQDQVEAPFDVGMVLCNSARSYFYELNLEAFRKRLPILRRMTSYILDRYEYSKKTYPENDPHYGLIWGSPEADLGRPGHDTPADHPYYYENSTGVWRGLKEHAAALRLASKADPDLAAEAEQTQAIADEMRINIERSLKTTMSHMNDAMKVAGIVPFYPEDIDRSPTRLTSYETHRFMQDWFLSDWGDLALDLGHLKHREIAGMLLVGLPIDDNEMRTSNFMDHGTLAVHIRQKDYRQFLLTTYALACFAADSGNRYAPEDALIPGGYAGEGFRYWWASSVNSTLQPTMALRWLLCYEESDHDICHLQKAAPKHWFKPGKHIAVGNCPTRFGHISWRTDSLSRGGYEVEISFERDFTGDIHVHIHPGDGATIRRTSAGRVEEGVVVIECSALQGKNKLKMQIS